MTKSSLVGKTIVISHPEVEGELLVVEVEIDCPDCGKVGYQFMGHHLKAVRNILIEYCDQYPQLTGSDAGLEVVKRLQFTGTSSPEPEKN